MPKGSQRRGLQTPHWRNSNPISKKKFQNYWPNKKRHFWILTMFQSRPGKVVKRKSTLFPNKYQSFSQLWVAAVARNGFLAGFSLFGKTAVRGTSGRRPSSKMAKKSARRPKNGPLSGRMASYWKTEDTQSYLRMWVKLWSHWVGSIWAQKWELHGRSVKKCRYLWQKLTKIGFGDYPRASRATMTTQTSCLIGVQS